MNRHRAAVGLVVLLALAGCTGSGVQADGPVTVTPAPVPTDDPTTPTYRLAPGLAESGVVGPLSLASAHAEHLRSAPFHVRIEERTARPDGRTNRRVLEATYVNRTAYRIRVRAVSGNRTVLARSLYADGTALYERHVTDDGVRYYLTNEGLDDQSPYPPDRLGSRTQRDELYVALVGTSAEYVGTEEVDGRELHRISASGATRPGFIAAWEYVDAVSDYEFEALVTDAGFVRAYRVRYVATDAGERIRVDRRVRWSAVGNATVPVPDWYETARERTGE